MFSTKVCAIATVLFGLAMLFSELARSSLSFPRSEQRIQEMERRSEKLHRMLSRLTYNCQERVYAGGNNAERKLRSVSVGDAMDGEWTLCMTPKMRRMSNADARQEYATGVKTPCNVFSIGISTDWSFDESMAAIGCAVHSYDPSIGVAAHKRNTPFERMDEADLMGGPYKGAISFKPWYVLQSIHAFSY